MFEPLSPCAHSVYWFEIIECFRKLALTGMPVWFEMGSTPQLTFGLLVSFFSFGACASAGLDQAKSLGCHLTLLPCPCSTAAANPDLAGSADALFAPYAKEEDDKLAQLCQAQTFFSLVASIILSSVPRESPTNRNMGVLLSILTALPIVVGLAMEFTSGKSKDGKKNVAIKAVKWGGGKLIAYLRKKRAEHGRRQRKSEKGERAFRTVKAMHRHPLSAPQVLPLSSTPVVDLMSRTQDVLPTDRVVENDVNPTTAPARRPHILRSASVAPAVEQLDPGDDLEAEVLEEAAPPSHPPSMITSVAWPQQKPTQAI